MRLHQFFFGLPMRLLRTILALSMILSSCADHSQHIEAGTTPAIKDTSVSEKKLTYQKENSLWTLNGQAFSGYAVTKYEDGSLKRKFGILNGKKQNEDTVWFPDRKINSITNYHHGKLHGQKKIWTSKPSYSLIADYNFNMGKGEGKQTKYYPTGELFQIIHLSNGKEEGLQQAYRKNGDLYANYEAKNGRIFGMKKAALCYGLDDQEIQKDE